MGLFTSARKSEANVEAAAMRCAIAAVTLGEGASEASDAESDAGSGVADKECSCMKAEDSIGEPTECTTGELGRTDAPAVEAEAML
jgi:hypothetical protein